MKGNTVELVDAAILEGLTNSRRKPPFTGAELREVTTVDAAVGAATLQDLKYCSRLEDLYLNWSCAKDYSVIGDVGEHLSWLQINCSTVTDLGFTRNCPEVWSVELRFNHIEDLSPLLEHENLDNMSIHVVGNPLTEESFYEVLPELEARASLVYADEEEIWRMQRRMWEEGLRASYGDWRGTEMVVQSLACRLGEKVRFEISPEALERELSVEGADVEAIGRKYWTPPYSREGCTERGGAEAARGWIGEVKLADALRVSLNGLVDRLGDAVEYAREERRVCAVTERRMYGWHPTVEPDGGRPGLPEWLCRWRSALAFAAVDSQEVPLGLSDAVTEPLTGQPVVLRPMGLANRDEKRALTDRFGAFPVAWVGADAHHALVIRLGEPDVRRLYLVDTRRLYRWAFDPWETVAFEGPEELVDALEGAAADVDGRLAELGDQPPDVVAPQGERITMSAEAAGEQIADAELDPELAESLMRLVDEMGECGFVREDARRAEFDQVMHQARFPRWYRQWRTTLAQPAAPESSASGTRIRLRFRAGSWQEGQGYGDKKWVMTPTGVHLDHLRHKLIDRYGVLPVAHESHKILGIRLDGSDQTIYSFDPSLFGADEDFDPFESPAFSGPAELVDAIEAVGASGDWVERG
jgi:hypothetical protein